jgi:hypothetical protein
MFSYEGHTAMAKRIYALRQKYPGFPWDEIPWHVELMHAPLVSDKGGKPSGRVVFERAMAEFRQRFGDPGLVIVDPLRNALGGSDSEPKLTAPYMALAGEWVQNIGCTWLTLHHPGHANTDRARGDSGIEAGVDTNLHVKPTMPRAGNIIARKQRDDARLALQYELEVLELGKDQDGDAVTTCVAVPPASSFGDLTERQRTALVAIKSVLGADGLAPRTKAREASGLERKDFNNVVDELVPLGRIEKAGTHALRVVDLGGAAMFDEDDDGN